MKKVLMANDSFLGFLDNMTAMKRGRVENVLTKLTLIKEDNEVMEKRDFVLMTVKDKQYQPDQAGNEYLLTKDNLSYQVNKTEYDFACYLVEHGFTDDETVNAKIEDEKAKKQREAEAAEAAEKARQAAETEKAVVDEWIKKETENYSDEQKISIQKEIFMDIYGTYYDHAKRTLVLIDNFDKPGCKDMLKDVMHRDNAASLKTFACITGLKVPNTNKAIREMLDSITSADFVGIVPYKKRKTPEKAKEEIFWMARPNQASGKSDFIQTMGKPLFKYGIQMFIHKVDGLVSVSSADCGYRIAAGKSEKLALEALKETVKKYGAEKINEMIYNHGEKYGWSPYSLQK